MAHTTNTVGLLSGNAWVSAVYRCDDVSAVNSILVGCAEIVLPYWDARYQNDEIMGRIVVEMRRVASNPDLEARQALKSLIPEHRLPRRWDLSPPPGWIDDTLCSHCPADFAGDAIAFAALAMVGSIDLSHLHLALDTTIETMARLFGERDPDADSQTDHRAISEEYVRMKLLNAAELQSNPNAT